MKDQRVAQRYARALLELAEQSSAVEGTHRDLLEANILVAQHPEISCLLMNTTIAREEKEDFLEKILPDKISSLVLNFIKVLVKKRRFQDLAPIAEEFNRLYEEKKGIQRVHVESAVPLDEILQEKLRRALSKKTGREVILETTVKPELLGGLVIDFEGTQIDASFRNALHELKQRLLT